MTSLQHARWCDRLTNLVVSQYGGAITLDPHVTGQCVLTLAEDGRSLCVTR